MASNGHYYGVLLDFRSAIQQSDLEQRANSQYETSRSKAAEEVLKLQTSGTTPEFARDISDYLSPLRRPIYVQPPMIKGRVISEPKVSDLSQTSRQGFAAYEFTLAVNYLVKGDDCQARSHLERSLAYTPTKQAEFLQKNYADVVNALGNAGMIYNSQGALSKAS